MSKSPLIISMDLEAPTATQFTGWAINSLCMFNGKVVMAGDAGIFTHEGDKDGTAKISAYAQLPPFSTGRQLRPRCIHTNGEGGDVDVTVTLDDRVESKTYRLLGDYLAGQRRQEVKCERVRPGGNMVLKFSNVNGSDFAIDQVDATVIQLTRRPGRG